MPSAESAVTVIEPGTRAFKDLNTASHEVKRRSTRKYNELADQYNGARIGSIIKLDTSFGTSLSNLTKILEYRGLGRDTDFTLLKVSRGSDGKMLSKGDQHLLIRKESDSRMQVLG